MKVNDIKIGDVVRLAGGGPAMTVTGFFTGSRIDTIQCMWFDSMYRRCVAAFNPGALQPY